MARAQRCELTNQEPAWFDDPAISRVSATSPDIIEILRRGGANIEPFNFFIACYPVAMYLSTDYPNGLRLIAPYETDPRKWTQMPWYDQRSGQRFRITTSGHGNGSILIRVKTMREIYAEYATHPEAKAAGADGAPCNRQTRGLLARRFVEIEEIELIGKETNYADEQVAGLVTQVETVLSVYKEPVSKYGDATVGLAARTTWLKSKNKPTICQVCKGSFFTASTGRPRRSCSDKCRQRGHRNHVRLK